MSNILTVIPTVFNTIHAGVEVNIKYMSQFITDDSDITIVKITNGEKSIYANICDYKTSPDLDDYLYMSEWMMNILNIDFGVPVTVDVLTDIHPANYIKIKPSNEAMLYSVDNVEEFFTLYLKNFKVIQKGIKYPIFRNGREFYFEFDEIKVGDNEDVEVAISNNVDLITYFSEPIEKMPIVTRPKVNTSTNKSSKFEAFTGQGYKLSG